MRTTWVASGLGQQRTYSAPFAPSISVSVASLIGRGRLAERRGRDPGLAGDGGDQHRDLVEEAPRPLLVGLERADQRMAAAPVVGGGGAVRRGVAAADGPALEADQQVEPLPAAGPE